MCINTQHYVGNSDEVHRAAHIIWADAQTHTRSIMCIYIWMCNQWRVVKRWAQKQTVREEKKILVIRKRNSSTCPHGEMAHHWNKTEREQKNWNISYLNAYSQYNSQRMLLYHTHSINDNNKIHEPDFWLIWKKNCIRKQRPIKSDPFGRMHLYSSVYSAQKLSPLIISSNWHCIAEYVRRQWHEAMPTTVMATTTATHSTSRATSLLAVAIHHLLSANSY